MCGSISVASVKLYFRSCGLRSAVYVLSRDSALAIIHFLHRIKSDAECVMCVEG